MSINKLAATPAGTCARSGAPAQEKRRGRDRSSERSISLVALYRYARSAERPGARADLSRAAANLLERAMRAPNAKSGWGSLARAISGRSGSLAPAPDRSTVVGPCGFKAGGGSPDRSPRGMVPSPEAIEAGASLVTVSLKSGSGSASLDSDKSKVEFQHAQAEFSRHSGQCRCGGCDQSPGRFACTRSLSVINGIGAAAR